MGRYQQGLRLAVFVAVVAGYTVVASSEPRVRRVDTSLQHHEERRVVYGTDDRHEHSAATAFNQNLGTKTVMLVRRTQLQENADGTWRLLTTTVHGTQPGGNTQGGGCADVPFATQKVPGFCSGTLITSTKVATAGHCMVGQSDCERTAVIFNAIDTVIAGAGATSSALPANTVYNCSEQIAGTLSSAFSSLSNAFNLGYGGRSIDWKVFSLSATVPGAVATPATVKTTGQVTAGESIMMIGHPSGLPRKYAGATVSRVYSKGPDGSYVFVSNLDAFAGNSGSGVFDSSGNLVGILVSGATDFDVSSGGCVTVNECPDNAVAACQAFRAANGGSANGSCVDASGDSCVGETSTGANILASVFVLESGCDASTRPCLNGGTCNTSNLCECPSGFVGPDCVMEIENTFCNGQTSIGWLQCTLIVNGQTLASAVDAAASLRCGTSRTGTTASGTHFTGANSPEVFFGINLTESTTVTIDTCGSSFDTLLYVWNESTIRAFTSEHASDEELAQNDDIGSSPGFGCTGTTSGLSLTLDAGVYIVQVEGFNNAQGTFNTTLQCSCSSSGCDAAYESSTGPLVGYTFSDSTKTCGDVSVSSLDECSDACAIVVFNSYGLSRTATSASYADTNILSYQQCNCESSGSGGSREDTLCQTGPDPTAVALIVVFLCLCCCGCCGAAFYFIVYQPQQRRKAANASAVHASEQQPSGYGGEASQQPPYGGQAPPPQAYGYGAQQPYPPQGGQAPYPQQQPYGGQQQSYVQYGAPAGGPPPAYVPPAHQSEAI